MDVAAGAQTTVAVATDRDQGNKKITINDNARQLLNAYAAIRGYVLSQEAVVWHYPLFDEAKVRANGIQIDIGRDPSVDETRQLYQAVFDATGRDDWAPAFVPTVGWRVLNFDDTVPNKEFAKRIIDVLKSLPDSFPASSVDTFKSEGDYISNDWKENPNGEGYRSWISGAGRSDLQGWVEGDLRDRTRRVEEEFAERYGWGRPNATGDRQDRTGAEGRSESLPRYGRPIDGNAVTAFGLHYSKAQRDELSSAYFGTGMKAEERIRLGIAKDPRIKRRLYFYTDTGRGIVPESDVGAHAHSVQLDNLYDMDVDALKLYKRENEDGSYRSDHTRMNEFESAIIDAGYDGYVTHQFGKGGAAVLLGTHSVPVKYEGTGAGATVPRTAGPRFPEARQLQRDIMADRSLPSGQMKGSEWKRMLADRVDLRYLEDDKYYYKSDLIPRESTRRMAPNGKPSNLSEQQWLQVRTPEFKAWFGDWEKHAKADNPVGSLWSDDKVSKVVAENGEPLVVYHVTQKGGFTVMDPDKGDKHRSPMIFAAKTRDTARTYAGRGQEIDLTAATVDVAPRKIGKEWYAVDKTGDGSYAYNVYGEYVPVEDAESYISANEAQFFIDTDLEQVLQDSGDHQAGVYPLFLNIRNPNESDFEGGNWDGNTNGLYEVLGEDGDNIYADDGRRLMPLDEAEVLAETVDGAEVNSVDWLGESTNSVAEEAKRMDMDGAIIRNVVDDGGQGYDADADDVFVFFDSNQAKSATQNTGAFSPTDPDIRRSESRAPIYYSQLARSVEQAPVKVFSTGKQVAAWLAGNASKLGVKKDEIEATGVTDWLQTQGKVTREQVSEYLAQGGVKVGQVQLATYKPATGQPIGDAELDAEVDRMIEDAFGDEATPPQEARYIPTTTQPGFALTPELRATAQAGMPMFSTSRATANRWAYQNRQFVHINDQKFQDTTDREFARVVAEFDKTRDPEMLRAVIPAMAQPNVLQMLGLPNQWLGWLGDIVAKVRSKHKVMLPGDKLNELLRSPALVIQSGDDLEIISDHVVNGDPLMFAIIPDTTETFGLRPGEKLRIT